MWFLILLLSISDALTHFECDFLVLLLSISDALTHFECDF